MNAKGHLSNEYNKNIDTKAKAKKYFRGINFTLISVSMVSLEETTIRVSHNLAVVAEPKKRPLLENSCSCSLQDEKGTKNYCAELWYVRQSSQSSASYSTAVK